MMFFDGMKKNLLFDKKNMNHKTDNKYFVKIPQRFIEDFNID
jgi:hypothetical protein